MSICGSQVMGRDQLAMALPKHDTCMPAAASFSWTSSSLASEMAVMFSPSTRRNSMWFHPSSWCALICVSMVWPDSSEMPE